MRLPHCRQPCPSSATGVPSISAPRLRPMATRPGQQFRRFLRHRADVATALGCRWRTFTATQEGTGWRVARLFAEPQSTRPDRHAAERSGSVGSGNGPRPGRSDGVGGSPGLVAIGGPSYDLPRFVRESGEVVKRSGKPCVIQSPDPRVRQASPAPASRSSSRNGRRSKPCATGATTCVIAQVPYPGKLPCVKSPSSLSPAPPSAKPCAVSLTWPTAAPSRAHVIRHAVQRAGIDGAEVDDVVLGCAFPRGQWFQYRPNQRTRGAPARSCQRHDGKRFVLRVCQSIALVSHAIAAGSINIAVAGGTNR